MVREMDRSDRLLYRLNEARLARYNPGAERQDAAFARAQGELKKALDEPVRAGPEGTGRPAGASARGQGASLAAEPSARG